MDATLSRPRDAKGLLTRNEGGRHFLKKRREPLDAALTAAFGATSQALCVACHKDPVRFSNVKSSLTIGNPHHLLFPEAVVHASVFHWTWALMPFNAKPALTV